MESVAVSSSQLWWILSAGLMLLGLVGTVLPMLPGTILVLAGAVLGAWIDAFTRVSGWTLAVIGVLAVLAWATDYVAAMLGAQKAGASKLALLGAAAGTVLGILMGLVGLLFMPLVGAMAGEYWSQRHRLRAGAASGELGAVHQQALKVGLATWIGLLLGSVIKLVLTVLMIGVFVLALLY